MSFWKKLLGIEGDAGDKTQQAEATTTFGYSKDDPIPCASIPEAYWYLGRLLRSDGSAVTFKRIGSFGSERLPDLIDGYRLGTSDGEEITVYIWPYAQITSSTAPRGFKLSPPQ